MAVSGFRLAAAAACLALAACETPTVDRESTGYDPSLPLANGGRGTYHWPLGGTIRVYVDASQPSGAPSGSALEAQVGRAFSSWQSTILYREFQLALVPRPELADVIVQYRSAPPLVSVPSDCGGGSGGGVTIFCTEGLTDVIAILPFSSGAGGSRVRMLVLIREDVALSPTLFPIIVTHEIGHVIGIGQHSPSPNDLMYGAPAVPAPSPADIRTLHYVLHRTSDFTL
ncbi:MAG: hypothetical protein M3068_08635 [Gemmatimonadota bacterium]|nr:hypothetical protein [Gemmatimonadota bacterium]